MILGAGYYQLPLIREAKVLGYKTIVCSIPGDYPGIDEADVWEDASTMDIDACLQVARKHKIDGICVCGTDTVLPTLGRIVDELNLPGPGYQSAIRSSNKMEMKRAFEENGVRTAPYAKATSFEECRQFAAQWNYPVVLKVVDSSGSRGIAIVKDEESMRRQYDEVCEATAKDYIIVEDFVEGEEFGAQAFVSNGALTVLVPHGDIIFEGETGVPVGHYAPFDTSPELYADIEEQLKRCIKALDIDNTAINADFILNEDKVSVLEIGARAGSTLLPELVSEYCGINYYHYLIRQAVGEKTNWSPTTRKPCVVEVLISDKSGKLIDYSLPEKTEDVRQLELIVKKGSEINSFKNAFDRIGHLVVTGDTLNQAMAKCNMVKSRIKLTIE